MCAHDQICDEHMVPAFGKSLSLSFNARETSSKPGLAPFSISSCSRLLRDDVTHFSDYPHDGNNDNAME